MDIKYQLVPPSNIRENNEERAILALKNRLILGLWSIYKDFHITLWDVLLQQANISIHLLRQAKNLPYLSAYTKIFGEFDYTSTPLAQQGTRI